MMKIPHGQDGDIAHTPVGELILRVKVSCCSLMIRIMAAASLTINHIEEWIGHKHQNVD